MKRNGILLATIATFVMALALGAKAQNATKVDGSWDLSMQGGNGNFTQTLMIQQDGDTLKGTVKGRRGDSPMTGKLDGNKIKFTVTRQTPNGERTLEYNGTVDGDTMKGTVAMGDNQREWTAKRSQPGSTPNQ